MNIYAAELTDGQNTWISPIHFNSLSECERYAMRAIARVSGLSLSRIVRFKPAVSTVMPWPESGSLIELALEEK